MAMLTWAVVFVCLPQFGANRKKEEDIGKWGTSDELQNGILEVGRWSPWMQWACSTSCGHGIVFRKRYCIPGSDLGFGVSDCEGASVQRSLQRCQRPCQQSFRRFNFIRNRNKPTFSPDEENAMSENLKSHMIALVQQNEVNLDCGHKLTEKLIKTHRGSSITWSLNDQFLKLDIHRMISPQIGVIKISKLSSKDNGVYMCQLQFGKQIVKILAVISLIVQTSVPHVILDDGEKLQLNCNCMSLKKLSTPLNVIWLHEGNEIVDRPIITSDRAKATPNAASFDLITNHANKNYSGVWICTVRAPELGAKWITNMVNVTVNERANAHIFSSIFYWIIAGIFIVLLAVVNTAILLHKFGLYRKKKQEKKKSEERRAELETLINLNDYCKK